jgi:hypothetical protein
MQRTKFTLQRPTGFLSTVLEHSGFFLKKFRGGLCDLNDLQSLDDVIYDNLRKLRDNPVCICSC